MPINATFHGFVETTTDSLLLFEACRRGVLPKISRRLQERERGSIRSGTIFIFDEKESGIKRWTDGLIWSPSRILGNFLIYRELGGRESLNDTKSPLVNPSTATNYYDKNGYFNQQFDDNYNSQHQQYNQYDYYQQNNNNNHAQCTQNIHNNNPQIFHQEQIQESTEEYGELNMEDRNKERNLVGSLTDTYKFRKGGLIKKTLSIHLNGCTQHMISYYTKEDVLKNRLVTPSSTPAISSLQISPELLLKQSFRVPPSVEFAEMALKRPSLSPSSTSSTTTSSSTMSNHLRRMSSTSNMTPSYHPYHQHQQYDDEGSGHARRNLASVSPSLSNPKHFSRRGIDYNDHNTMIMDSRRSSCQSIDSTPCTVTTAFSGGSLPDINDMHANINNRSSHSNNNSLRSLYGDIHETPTSQYQNISEKSYIENRGKIQRRHSNNYYHSNNSYTSHIAGNRRQNSCHLSSSPNLNNYGQKVHDIPTISSLPSPSFQQQQPILSPSRFLWSANNDDHSINEKPTFVSTRNYSPTSNDHHKQQASFPLATTPSPTTNNSLPRCFEATGKLILNGVSNNHTAFYNVDSTIIQNNNSSSNNIYFQQQQQQQQQQLTSVNLYSNNKHYE